jgi:hypothetical protein
MAPLILLVAMAAFVPTSSPERICRDAQLTDAGSDAQAYRACLHDEQSARDEIKRTWNHYSAEARSICTEPDAVSISCVEVLTCLVSVSKLLDSNESVMIPVTAA